MLGMNYGPLTDPDFNAALSAWLPDSPPDGGPFFGTTRIKAATLLPARAMTMSERMAWRWYRARAWFARHVLRLVVE